MDSIFQEDEYGCGTACVAMLFQVSYAEAAQICDDVYWKGYGIDKKPMINLLKQLGFRIEGEGRIGPKTPLISLTNDALLVGSLLPTRGSIKARENTYSHWMVWDSKEKAIRDPYRFTKPIWVTSYISVAR